MSSRQRSCRTRLVLIGLAFCASSGCLWQRHEECCPTNMQRTYSFRGAEAVRLLPCGPDACDFGVKQTQWRCGPSGHPPTPCPCIDGNGPCECGANFNGPEELPAAPQSPPPRSDFPMNTLETAGSGRWNQPVGRPPVVDAGEKQVSFEVGPPVANLPFQADYAEADVANGRDLTVLAETPRGIDGRQPEFPLNGHEESGMGNWNPPIEQRRMMHLPEQNALFETGSPATASPREAGHSESRIENRSDLAVLRDMPQPVATLRGLPPGATDEKSNLRNWDRPIYGDHTADSWQGLASFESNPSVSNPAPQSPITESYWESPRWYSENPSDLSVLGDLR